MDPRFYKHSAPLGLRLLSSEILFLRITTREKLAENRKYFRTQQETDWNRPQTFRPLGLRLLSSEILFLRITTREKLAENRKYFRTQQETDWNRPNFRNYSKPQTCKHDRI